MRLCKVISGYVAGTTPCLQWVGGGCPNRGMRLCKVISGYATDTPPCLQWVGGECSAAGTAIPCLQWVGNGGRGSSGCVSRLRAVPGDSGKSCVHVWGVRAELLAVGGCARGGEFPKRGPELLISCIVGKLGVGS